MARADSLPALGEAAALQEAFPSYSVRVCVRRGARPRYEVVTRDDGNPWCLISPDALEIWRELAGGVFGAVRLVR